MFRKVLFGAAVLSASEAFAAPPAAFLHDAIGANYSEVTFGRMIQSQGSTAQIRQFGAMLVRDHSKSLAQAQQIASRLRLHIRAALTPEARAEQAKLRHLRGPAFDREVRSFMIDDHRKDIAKFQAQANSGDHATSSYAAANVPVMQRHLAAAEALRG